MNKFTALFLILFCLAAAGIVDTASHITNAMEDTINDMR